MEPRFLGHTALSHQGASLSPAAGTLDRRSVHPPPSELHLLGTVTGLGTRSGSNGACYHEISEGCSQIQPGPRRLTPAKLHEALPGPRNVCSTSSRPQRQDAGTPSHRDEQHHRHHLHSFEFCEGKESTAWAFNGSAGPVRDDAREGGLKAAMACHLRASRFRWKLVLDISWRSGFRFA